jgi:hypothetical protein
MARAKRPSGQGWAESNIDDQITMHSQSALEAVSDLFAGQATDPKLSRHEALRRATIEAKSARRKADPIKGIKSSPDDAKIQ